MADRAPGAKSGVIRPDISSILGVLIALGGILGGLVLEGGKIAELAQPTSALIVLGGTLGAVMITTPLSTLLAAAKKLRMVFFETTHSPSQTIEEIITYASKARRNSIVSLETDLDNIGDPFLRKALTLAVNGTDLNALRGMMELDIALDEKAAEAEAKVYESQAGMRRPSELSARCWV